MPKTVKTTVVFYDNCITIHYYNNRRGIVEEVLMPKRHIAGAIYLQEESSIEIYNTNGEMTVSLKSFPKAKWLYDEIALLLEKGGTP
jgi:hypothetical protein